MYKNTIAVILFFLFLVPFLVYAQKKSAIKIADEGSFKVQAYPVPGSDLLRHKDIEVAQFLKNNPGYLERTRLMKPAWSFAVGSTHTWLAYNFTNDQNYSVPSTCQAVGANCYVFVADDQWSSRVNQSAVDQVVNEFDNHTPANPGQGIYQTCINTYGNPPNIDGDQKIIILICDIADGYTGSGGYVAGYFYSKNEVTDNNAEIYFMDSNPADLASEGGLNFAFGTAAHEFQHMINWNYHQGVSELTFINESLSKSAEILCGYGASMQELYANETNHYLFDWRDGDNTLVLNDYARAQRFSLYLMEQFGVSSLKEFVQSYSAYGLLGIEGLKKVLAQHSTTLGKVVLNWEIANGLNNTEVNSAYGYSYSPLPVSAGTTIYNPNIGPAWSSVIYLGAEYFTFTNSTNLTVTFYSAGINMVVKAFEIGESLSRVVDVPLNSAFSEPDYPSVYNTIRFAVIDTNELSSQDYQYQFSGTPLNTSVELKWDESEPMGYLPLPAGDTVCVIFDAFGGGKLDSIRIGLRQAGSISGGIWEYNSSWNPSPLQTNLGTSFIASITTTPGLPYPVPWTNWATVDLSSQNILTDFPFAAGVVIPSVNNPKVMVTETPGTGFANSFTYDVVGSRWTYYVDSTLATYQYLMRAYVSIVTGGVKRVVELSPIGYSLQQNYPNPFNPGTKIRYSIQEKGNVSVKIYDMTGKEVINLVNTFQDAGNYEIGWDGRNQYGIPVASGMYFYSIKAGTFTETKKMILVK
ncbi:MAG TPA: T9SS type A sorting domain-containing protein [Ignavibacteriaceae bacterium]|nr:T9SS type A sorting domain-containing protein [Ignavibacteriaceae bacterium]